MHKVVNELWKKLVLTLTVDLGVCLWDMDLYRFSISVSFRYRFNSL